MEQFELVLGKDITKVRESEFKNRKDITSIKFSDTITHIYGYAFMGCTNLKVVVIPRSVKYIGRCAFFNTSAVIFVPSSIETIDEYAFSKNNVVFFECGQNDFKGYHEVEYDDCPPPDYYHRGPYSPGPIEKFCFERGCTMFFNKTYEEFLNYIKEEQK